MERAGGTKRGQDQATYQTFFSFFGLHENPFRANPDPRYLYFSTGIRRALNELTVGSQSGKSLIVLTGEAGTGKTSLINHLLASLRKQDIPVAFVFNSHLDINNLFEFILSSFGVRFEPGHNPNLRILLTQWLNKQYVPGKAPVIILDEAQGFSTAVLEEIRMLLNMDVGGESLVRMVLAGQPELDSKLHRPELRQLRQRIMVRCRTAPLSLEDTYGYIQHRLRVAGSPDGAAFSPAAIDAVYFYSAGVPRVINLICEHSLINAYSDGTRPVLPQAVEDVAWEFRFDDFRPLPSTIRDRAIAEVIPMSSGASRMNMSTMGARESAPVEAPAVDAELLADLMKPAPSADRSTPLASAQPAARSMAAAAAAAAPARAAVEPTRAPKPTAPSPSIVNPPVSQKPPARPPLMVNPENSPAPRVASSAAANSVSSQAPPMPLRAVASPAPPRAWKMPRPIVNMSWSRRASESAMPIKARLRATGARLEASVTRIVHSVAEKLDELKPVEKLQRLADTSMHWLRQPMRHSHRTPFGTREKS